MVLSQRKGEAHRKRKSDEVVPPVSNVGYTCALGPPYRVHRACPIYRLGPSSFRRSAFFFYEAPKGAKNTRILPQLALERRPPVSNFGYTCALGPPYRVHRACPIYRLGPSSFRRSAFFFFFFYEAPKGAKRKKFPPLGG